MKRPFSVQRENLSSYQRLANLEDSRGRKALTPSHLRIVEYIGSFPREAGCFASDAAINSETINARSPKTVRRHLEYLAAIQAISVTQEPYREGSKRVYRLESPEGHVLSQKEFRVQKGLSEYAYAVPPVPQVEHVEVWGEFFEEKDVDTGKICPVFSQNSEAKFAHEKELFADDQAKFAPILYTSTKDLTRLETDLPSKSSLVHAGEATGSADSGSLRDPNVTPNDRRHVQEGQTAGPPNRSFAFSNLSTNNNDDGGAEAFDEPLLDKQKIKHPKNERERRSDAVQKSNQGHIINPIGMTDNRKRSCNWKLARDIGPTGAVTIPQLNKKLAILYNQAFGQGIYENMLSRDKSALTAMFARLAQAFIEVCNFEPSNRDLAEYFDWFFEPQRLQKILTAADKYTNPDKQGVKILHFQQLCGSVFIQRFYNQVIKIRQLNARTPDNGPITKAEEFALKVDQFYREFETAANDDEQFCYAMVANGFALAAQFLHDEKKLDESECKQRIIKTMAAFIKANVADPKKAVDYLNLTLASTAENASLLRPHCIWFEWPEKTNGLIEIALQQAGVQLE